MLKAIFFFLTPRSVSQHRVRLWKVLVGSESDSTQCLSILDFHKFNFMTPRSVSQCGVQLHSALVGTELASARSNLFCEYLRENKSFNKAILACLLGAQVGLIHGIKICQKIL